MTSEASDTVESFRKHYSAMSEDELLRLGADVVSLIPTAREALQNEFQARQFAMDGIDWTAQPDMPQPGTEYAWGRFQGWTFLVMGSLALLGELSGKNWWGVIGASLAIVMGRLLVVKDRSGLILFYVNASIFSLVLLVNVAFTVIMFVSGGTSFVNMEHVAAGSMMATLLIGWYVIPAVFYYPKRWKQFTFGSKKSSVG